MSQSARCPLAGWDACRNMAMAGPDVVALASDMPGRFRLFGREKPWRDYSDAVPMTTQTTRPHRPADDAGAWYRQTCWRRQNAGGTWKGHRDREPAP